MLTEILTIVTRYKKANPSADYYSLYVTAVRIVEDNNKAVEAQYIRRLYDSRLMEPVQHNNWKQKKSTLKK